MGQTESFFAELARREHEPLLRKATGSVRFDLAQGRKREHWVVTVRKGDLEVSREGAPADCVIRAPKDVFEKIVSGRMNAMAAVLRGAVEIEGDVSLVVLCQRLFPGPPRARRRRAGAEAAGR